MRIIVPWKYGYKSPKSIVKIELVPKQPGTFWSSKPYQHEYGYLSNVNPQHSPSPDGPRNGTTMLVANATPRRGPRRPTLIFNGYADQVGHLYPDRTHQTPASNATLAECPVMRRLPPPSTSSAESTPSRKRGYRPGGVGRDFPADGASSTPISVRKRWAPSKCSMIQRDVADIHVNARG